ncbi:MAG: hypothetical protein GY770_10870 [Aestuariibacter sp.]|nr:hypothetical protein [Aestuariibacter sp.]
MKDNSGNNYIYAGDKTKLYNINGVTVTDYSQVGDYTDNSEAWGFIKWGEQVIASKLGDTPQVLTLGGTTFADLSGSPPQGRTISTIRDFVIIGNTWDSTDGNVTNRIRWSGFNDETGWTVGTNQSDYQDLEGRGGAVQRIAGGEFGIIFQEKSIWRQTYVGTPTVFQFDEIEPGRGTPAAGSVAQYGATIFYLGQDGFYVLENGTTSAPIGANKVDKYFWNDVNESYLSSISATISPDDGVVMWAYPSTSSNGEPDKIIIYSYKTGKWSHAELNTQLLFQGATSAYTLEDLDAFGTIDTLTSSLDSAVWQGGSFKTAAFNTDNKLSFFTGNIMAATLKTGEIGSEAEKTTVQSVRPVIDGVCTLALETRNSRIDTPVEGLAESIDSSGKANFRTNKRYHRVKMVTSGDFTHAQGVEVVSIARGNR